MQELTASINAKNIIDLEKTASFLGISTATVRNWVKCGYLQAHTTDNRYFHIEEIENVKANIKNGDLNKLNGRANKSKAERTFIPDEYLQDGVSVDDITKIINFVSDNNIDISLSLLLLSLNLLQREKILLSITIPDLISKNVVFANKQIGEEVKAWLSEIKNSDIKSEYTFLLNCTIPKQRDALGFLYQSLLLEGKKSQSGSYYTPEVIVNEIIKDYAKKDSKILDPCCGTGQFLLAFADVIENPKNIYGVDVDELAVRIARLNILIKYKNQNFAPNIVCKNTLFGIGNYDLFSLNDENIRDFDVIATNPPWGVHFSKSWQMRENCFENGSRTEKRPHRKENPWGMCMREQMPRCMKLLTATIIHRIMWRLWHMARLIVPSSATFSGFCRTGHSVLIRKMAASTGLSWMIRIPRSSRC